jgi:hypothetical protein
MKVDRDSEYNTSVDSRERVYGRSCIWLWTLKLFMHV